ncbi:aspartyl-phosphate phosphatase Spo0E family protein [Tepidibacter formicigenes]|jgi:hypothetical protein|uniref:aspartyl-phosphate phosphatase Spo0E family protein n=1 Tax=Tepidibacter formicigenes TaxID=227138 RepID=UPI0009FBC8C2|nr:aspartyl-phosphate phosphatase Spo0E family protein [Tepidibacter formicigenes]
MEFVALESKINTLRERLNSLLNYQDNILVTEEVLKVSQELDICIVEYTKLKNNIQD